MHKDTEYSRHTITAALPYANGPIHIGHLAGVYIPADIYTRYLRLQNKDVLFVCGSDEHGVPITIRAKEEGVSPQEVADKYDDLIRRSFREFGISFDVYSRTSRAIHHETAADFFKTLYGKSALREIESEQYFDEETNQFLADRYIQGTCPRCGFEEAFGDQCERCGSTLSPSELGNPRSMLSGSKPVLKMTKHWYLPLEEYENWLRKWILEEHVEWKANVYGQCKSWLDHGLQPRAVTRDLEWGVPVPLPDAEGKVLYVWFDAPIGYISATKEWATEHGRDWKPYWCAEDTRLLHFIGKDNIVFHCIIFPSMLREHGGFILPDNVPANEFLNLEGNKISTSRNWAVWLHEYLEDFPGKEDVLRYTLCANAPETKDNDFTWKDFQAKNNNELVAILGNFVNRAMVLTQKYFDGVVHAPGQFIGVDHEVIDRIQSSPARISGALEGFKFREALAAVMDLARAGNKYFADTEPWKLIREDTERVKTILYLGVQVVANLAIVAEPFLPHTCKKINAMLGVDGRDWSDAGSENLLTAGTKLLDSPLLFEKIPDEAIEYQVQKLTGNREGAAAHTSGEAQVQVPPAKDEIPFEEFVAMDMRIGTIVEAQQVEKSNKLLKLTVDTGVDVRTVVSGIAKYYSPEQVTGKQVMVLLNLKPRNIMGIESRGMILLAEEPDGRLVFMVPEDKATNGSAVG
jgi:methionyl-tRNA synthetase